MSNYLQGPWKVLPLSEARNPWIVANKDGLSIADCAPGSPDVSSDDALANARLIAAAPGLLSTAKEAKAAIDGCLACFGSPTQEVTNRLDDATDALREIIASAGGCSTAEEVPV